MVGDIIELEVPFAGMLKHDVPEFIALPRFVGVATDEALTALSPQANPFAKFDATDGTLQADAAQLLYDEYPE